MNFAPLKTKMDEAWEHYQEAAREYKQAILDAAPLKVDDLITANDGTVAKVVSVCVKHGRVEIEAINRNKDGAFGKQYASLWRDKWNDALAPLKAFNIALIKKS